MSAVRGNSVLLGGSLSVPPGWGVAIASDEHEDWLEESTRAQLPEPTRAPLMSVISLPAG